MLICDKSQMITFTGEVILSGDPVTTGEETEETDRLGCRGDAAWKISW
jgi:hypothetical protein